MTSHMFYDIIHKKYGEQPLFGFVIGSYHD